MKRASWDAGSVLGGRSCVCVRWCVFWRFGARSLVVFVVFVTDAFSVVDGWVVVILCCAGFTLERVLFGVAARPAREARRESPLGLEEVLWWRRGCFILSGRWLA